jgi:hypothetical protein
MGGLFIPKSRRRRKPPPTRQKFRQQYVCAQEIVELLKKGLRFVSVTAPVKSGKKIIKMILASSELRFDDSEYIFVSSLARKASESQLVELAENGFDCIVRPSKDLSKSSAVPTNQRLKTIELIEHISNNPDKKIVICWDESDFGLDMDGNASPLLMFLTTSAAENVSVVFFSATNQEIDNSSFAERPDFAKVRLNPSKDYRGAPFYLANDLVRHLGKNEDFTLSGTAAEISETGKKFLDEFQRSDKQLAVVRLSQRNKYRYFCTRVNSDDGGYLEDNFSKRGIAVLAIDMDSSSEYRELLTSSAAFERFMEDEIKGKYGLTKLIVVLNHTFGRSVELGVHEKMYGWFEQRGTNKDGDLKSNFATQIQSILRTAFYHNEEEGGPVLDKVRIKLWVPREILEAEASGVPVDGLRQAARVDAPSAVDVVSHEDCFSGPFTMPMGEAREHGKGNRTHIDTNAVNLAAAMLNKGNPGTGANRYKGELLIFAGSCPWESNPEHASLHREDKRRLTEEHPDIDWEDKKTAKYWIYDPSKMKSGKKSVEGRTTRRSAYSSM